MSVRPGSSCGPLCYPALCAMPLSAGRAQQTCSARVLPDRALFWPCPANSSTHFPAGPLLFWCHLWSWPWAPGFGLCSAFFCFSPTLLFSVSFYPLSSLPLLLSLLWVCLAQGRLSEEIEKLRQEVDQLKGRGGPFVDGIHSRYAQETGTLGRGPGWPWMDPGGGDFLPTKDCSGPQGPPPIQGGTLRFRKLGKVIQLTRAV